MRKLYTVFAFILLYSLSACMHDKKQSLSCEVSQWMGRTILYPDDMVFTSLGKDTVPMKIEGYKYAIISYVDSTGCTNCKLQLPKWKEFMEELRLKYTTEVPIYLFLHIRNLKEMSYILKRDKFAYPVCMDVSDSFNKLNNFSENQDLHTFLIDAIIK